MTIKFDYSAFEDHFRGDPLEIRKKLAVYLPLVKLITIDESHPVLDIGCGRGEWLSLLRDNGIPAMGVEFNADFASSCKESGLQVEMMDVFDYFKRYPDKRFSLITGFHVIEHFPFDKQVELLKLLFDRLVSDGILLLETPNPENNTVGACTFYIDPTHHRPLPPPLLEFLALQAGFGMSRIVRLNRDTLGITLPFMPENLEHARYYNRLYELLLNRVFQAPDYALISCKGSTLANGMVDAVDELIRSESDFQHYNDASNKMYERTTQQTQDVREYETRLDEKEYLLALKEVELSKLHVQLNQLTEQLHQSRKQSHAYERELRSLYHNELGKFLRKYKKWKRRLKAQTSDSGQERTKVLPSVKSLPASTDSDLSPSARKIYRRLSATASQSIRS